MKLPGLRLRLATSQLIRQWAQRQLPNGKIISGQVLNPKTMNYQTLKPEKDGLFCERIFGPVHDSICACGRQPLRGQKFCSRCEVEYISTRVRRYRLGYIQLITAAAHIWFLKGRPSYFSLFLNLPKKKIECLLYCTRNISRTIFPKELESLNFYSIQSIKTHLHMGQHKGPRACNLIKHPVIPASGSQGLLKAGCCFWSFASEKSYWRFNKNITKFQYVQRIRMFKTGSSLPSRYSSFLNILKVHRNSEKTTDASKAQTNWINFFSLRSGQIYREAMPFISSITLFYYFLLEKFVFDKRIRKFSNSHWIFQSNWLKDPKKNLSSNILNFYNQLSFQIPLNPRNQKKSRWQKGGLRDSALYFGFSLVSKMLSWQMTAHWFSFVYFLIHYPQKGDFLNKFYQGPPGIVCLSPMEYTAFRPKGGKQQGGGPIEIMTGVQLMRTWLTQLTQYQCQDGRLLEIQIRLNLLQFERCEPLSDNEFVQRILLFRRFKYLRSFRHTQMNPASMILSVLPVLPPDLRPIIQLDNNQIAVSDLNKLYQTVLLRNKRLSRLTVAAGDSNFHCLNSEALRYAQRLLQESVDALMDNGTAYDTSSQALGARGSFGGKAKDKGTRRPLKSLSDLFKGKKGRFRQNLLGKRVDYSGRSVIVVGPYLRIYECGLPKEIAYELFQPFILRILMSQNRAQTILGAKKLFQQKPRFIWNLLKEVVHSHPILLNRAPTLHRLSIQAFLPRLIEGKAILLHPLVCAAFNADFDGDQMGVHLPLCFEARAEAWKITWSQNNLFSVATGSPSCPPSQDMILGSSFLTTRNIQKLGLNFLKIPTLYKKMIGSPREIDLFKQTGFFNLKSLSSGGQGSFPEENQNILTSLIQKRNLLKSLLFKKPFFFKSPSSQRPEFSIPRDTKELDTNKANFFIPSNQSGELRETTLSSINSVSFSQKFHPFWHQTNPLGVQDLEPKPLIAYAPHHLFPVVHGSSIGASYLSPAIGWTQGGKRVKERSSQQSMSESVGRASATFWRWLPGEGICIRNPQFFNQISIWCTYNPILHQFETEKKNQKLIEIRINLQGQFHKFRSQFFQQYHSSGMEVLRKFRTTYGRIQFYENLSLF